MKHLKTLTSTITNVGFDNNQNYKKMNTLKSNPTSVIVDMVSKQKNKKIFDNAIKGTDQTRVHLEETINSREDGESNTSDLIKVIINNLILKKVSTYRYVMNEEELENLQMLSNVLLKNLIGKCIKGVNVLDEHIEEEFFRPSSYEELIELSKETDKRNQVLKELDKDRSIVDGSLFSENNNIQKYINVLRSLEKDGLDSNSTMVVVKFLSNFISQHNLLKTKEMLINMLSNKPDNSTYDTLTKRTKPNVAILAELISLKSCIKEFKSLYENGIKNPMELEKVLRKGCNISKTIIKNINNNREIDEDHFLVVREQDRRNDYKFITTLNFLSKALYTSNNNFEKEDYNKLKELLKNKDVEGLNKFVPEVISDLYPSCSGNKNYIINTLWNDMIPLSSLFDNSESNLPLFSEKDPQLTSFEQLKHYTCLKTNINLSTKYSRYNKKTNQSDKIHEAHSEEFLSVLLFVGELLDDVCPEFTTFNKDEISYILELCSTLSKYLHKTMGSKYISAENIFQLSVIYIFDKFQTEHSIFNCLSVDDESNLSNTYEKLTESFDVVDDTKDKYLTKPWYTTFTINSELLDNYCFDRNLKHVIVKNPMYSEKNGSKSIFERVDGSLLYMQKIPFYVSRYKSAHLSLHDYIESIIVSNDATYDSAFEAMFFDENMNSTKNTGFNFNPNIFKYAYEMSLITNKKIPHKELSIILETFAEELGSMDVLYSMDPKESSPIIGGVVTALLNNLTKEI